MKLMGITEAEARRHSWEWNVEQSEAAAKDAERTSAHQAALDVRTTYTATAAAFNGGDAAENMEGIVAALLNDEGDAPEVDEGGLMNLRDEMAQFGASPFERVKVSA